jgi:hypothetical protein
MIYDGNYNGITYRGIKKFFFLKKNDHQALHAQVLMDNNGNDRAMFHFVR